MTLQSKQQVVHQVITWQRQGEQFVYLRGPAVRKPRPLAVNTRVLPEVTVHVVVGAWVYRVVEYTLGRTEFDYAARVAILCEEECGLV